jgi:ABC-type transport system involved in multi-copper enzyme maturation permease subunit
VGDNARFGTILFQILTKWVQLPLLLFFAALSAASAISQEKDRRTFVLLLLTDLRAYEIVLGKLLGSLLQIALLLLGMLGALALIVLLGGVAPEQVAQAGIILAATALAAGSVGTLVALWREKTFQVLALTVLFLILYFCLVRGLEFFPAVLGWFSSGPEYGASQVLEDWQLWLDPFRALQAVLEPMEVGNATIAPAYGFAGTMVVGSILLNGWAMLWLRVWNPSGEPIMQREQPTEEAEKDRARAHAAPGAVRRVWANPIFWREVRTRAYGRRPLLVKLAYFLVLALMCGYGLWPLLRSGYAWVASLFGVETLTPLLSAAERDVLPVSPGIVLAGVSILSLILASAQAVTAITSERDTGALDLLLVTDLTPSEFVFGKLGGILYNTKEYLFPPFILAAVYAAEGLLATPPALHREELLVKKNVEALVCVFIALVVLFAFAKMLGVHVALRNENSRLAIINTLSTMFFLLAGTLLCIELIQINSVFEYQWASFIVFIGAGVGGLLWVLSADRPSQAITLASICCPIGMFYTIVNVLVAKPGSQESTDPLIPLLVTVAVFGLAIAAMLVPLLSEFDVALGRTSGPGE